MTTITIESIMGYYSSPLLSFSYSFENENDNGRREERRSIICRCPLLFL